MKVLHLITRLNSGGTAKWIEVLIRGHIENGDEVWLGAGNVEPDETEDPFFEASRGIRINHLSREISPLLLRDIRSFLEIRKIVKRIRPDLINTHTSKAGLIGRLVSITLMDHKPMLVHTFHGHLLYGYFSPWKTKIITKLERFLAKHTDALIVSGKKVKEELLLAGIGDAEKYFVINPGVKIDDSLSKTFCKDYFSLNQITVGWVGRMTDIKNPLAVFDLAATFPNIDFLVCGDGELLEDLRLDCPANVRLPGWVDANIAWAASDIAILTSKNEAQPIALVEAGLHSVPIIALNVGGVEGVVENGVNGYLVDNLEDMKTRIMELSKSAALRKMMGSRGKEKMTSDFGIASFKSKHFQLYRKLMEG